MQTLFNYDAEVNASSGRFGNALRAALFGTYDSMAQGVVDHAVRSKLSQGVPVIPQNSNALQVASSNVNRRDKDTLKELSNQVLSILPGYISATDSGTLDPLLDASLQDCKPLLNLLEKGAIIPPVKNMALYVYSTRRG